MLVRNHDDDVETGTDEPAQGRALVDEMHRVGGGLFLAGGALVVAVLVASRWPEMHRGLLAVTATVALGTGSLLWWLARSRPLPIWAFPPLAALGTVNITLTVLGSGPHGSGPFGVLYVFVCVYSFYYFPSRVAVGEVALTGVAYALVLGMLDVVDAPAQWVVVTGANVIIAAMIGRGGHRVREHLLAQQATVTRLEELDELRTMFLRAVSHELRTPLTSVLGYAQTLRHRGDQLEAEQQQVLVEAVERNALRLERLLGNLLDIDRIARGVLEPVRSPTHLGDLVHRVLDELPRPNHPVRVEVLGDVEAMVEASKVERIVENLVANAVRHTPWGTEIRVRVDGRGEDVVLAVEDDGPGLDHELARTLFDPFVQGPGAARSASPGTGIGLSLVASFAELHGGSATAGPSDTGGASFVVRLPRRGEEPAADDAPDPVA